MGRVGGASIRCMCKCVTKEMVFKLLCSVIDYMFSPFFRRRRQIAEVRSKKGSEFNPSRVLSFMVVN